MPGDKITRKIRDTAGVDVVEEAAEFHVLMLNARPDTASLSAIIVGLLAAMQDAQLAHKRARLSRMQLSAMIAYEDSLLDELVASVARQALELCAGDRSDLRYKALLPTAPSKVMKAVGGEEQDAYVVNILTLLAEDDAYASLAPLAAPLKAQHDKLSALQEQRDAAYQQEGIAFGKLSIARQRLIDAIHANHPRLLTLFPKQDSLVESFFVRSTV